ncbi:DEAD/DEAH box helicase family protein [uncultured Sneathiella sp.]|jgi:type III restriction enzyme|uniref:DEAD/DEAH box helicase n=1 Tax=uncultured Sneathiella sp. TaxID=879315 RepID=UPI0030D82684|tara:strand:+ start:69506 stop:72013 length:2508 start_codon:yes stop_codon:yes gene_type:complete
MKISLFDFQKDALSNLRTRLLTARRDASSENPQAITLSAPTGSGKTVIMTALFEAILDSPDAQLDWLPHEWEPQQNAVILWLSDMPELNEQTRRKIERQSDKVFRVGQLVTVDASFDEERLQGGRIYFINTQKLATDKLLTREGDKRTWSLWRTLTNTARAIPDRFYVVIDEAHRGMSNGRGRSAAQSIVQKFIKGDVENGLVRMPLIIGVSATPKRFNDLLADTNHTISRVTVPPEDVRESGLLKERILIHHPDVATKAELGLVAEATRRWIEISKNWETYCREEGERNVRPILVIQVEDGSGSILTKTNLGAVVKVIEDVLGRSLKDSEIAHSFMDKVGVKAAERELLYIEPSRIEEDPELSVVLFKMALSTGWDCPRAEVMMSFRRAEDHTYIAQLLGRMVRTPLARRIERRAELNDVHLFLPHFDSKAVKDVITALQTSEDIPPAEAADARELVVLNRRAGTENIFAAMSELVTYRVNAHRAQSDLRRYQGIAQRLTIDGIDDSAWEKAKSDAVAWIGDGVTRLKKSGQFDVDQKTLTRLALNTLAVESVTGVAESQEDYEIDVSDLDIDRQYQEAGRALGNGLHQSYWKAHAERDPLEVKLEVIVASRDGASMTELERRSKKAFNTLYDDNRAAIGKLHEQSRMAYERLRSASTTPEAISWQLQDTIDFRRDPKEPVWDRHLFTEDDGEFRVDLGTWEAGVLAEELARSKTVAWLRNLERKPWSLEIPYSQGGIAKPMFPDLLIVREVDGDFIFDILEPHNPSLNDNMAKAKGLADFAEKHGDVFGRVQLIRGGAGDKFIRLDLHRSEIRDRLRVLDKNTQLDALFDEFA